MNKFIINRSKWLRGEGSLNSFLLRESDGKQCCLGQYANFCDISDENILGLKSPLSLFRDQSEEAYNDGLKKYSKYSKLLTVDDIGCSHSYNTVELMSTNDDPSIFDNAREDRLKTLFANIGIEVTFDD